MAAQYQRLSEPEELFLDYVKRMARHREGREVLTVYVTRLEPGNRTRGQIDHVTRRLGELARKYGGEIFRFRSGDVSCVLHDAPDAQIEKTIFGLRHSFASDALIRDDDPDKPQFIERLDVGRCWDELEQQARKRVAWLEGAVEDSMATGRHLVHGEELLHPSAPAPAAPSSSPEEKPRSKPARPADKTNRPKRKAVRKVSVVRAELDEWKDKNQIIIGGTVLNLSEVLTCHSIFDLSGRKASVPKPVGHTVQIDRPRLAEAYTLANRMKMSERLEHFLAEEAEAGLVQLLDGMAPEPMTQSLDFRQSVCLTPQVILSPGFLLAVREWEKAGAQSVLFWFGREVLDDDRKQLSYVSDFLHEMGQLVGLRGLAPGDLGMCAARLPQVDGWALAWPQTKLARTPQAELDGLYRARDEWGAGSVFLNGLDNKSKVSEARAKGFLLAESPNVQDVNQFG